jgi:hypothetical protein
MSSIHNLDIDDDRIYDEVIEKTISTIDFDKIPTEYPIVRKLHSRP